MDISVGARSMGMGKAYVAVAEDAETVFVNPAGLGTVTSLKLGSMYTSLLDDVNYTVISGAYPMDNNSGTIGAGIINQTTTSIPLYNIYGTPEGTGAYGSNILFVSHGFSLSKTLLPSISDLYGGYTLKYFSKSASGYDAADMTGSGFAADMGLLYKPKGYMSYGLSLQNILAGSMNYASGVEDSIDSAMKVGAKAAILGDSMDGGSLYQSESKVDVALDYDIGIRGQVPATAHIGVEYQPQVGVNYIDRILTLRAGVNQVPTPTGNISNITLGVGINYQGVEFNYAYSPQYGDIPQTSTQFFSISYVGVPAAVKPIEEMKPLISQAGPMIAQLTPGDKIVTRGSTVLVQGKLSDPKSIAKVEINNGAVNVSDTGSFQRSIPVSTIGKHLVVVKATDINGKTEDHQVRVIRLMKFADVPEDYWAVNSIEQMATTGLIEGYPDGTFQPQRPLSRAELSTLLVKSKDTQLTSLRGKTFKDVSIAHWAAKYVKGAYDTGLVTGYPDKTFKPNNKITRAEGVAVLTRFGELPVQAALVAGPYPDVSARYWASPFIASARASGLLEYIGDNNFEPRRELTRAEAIEILAKTNYGKLRADNLFDWTVGFKAEPASPALASYTTPVAGRVVSAVGKPLPGKGEAVPQIEEFSDVRDEFWASNSIKYLATAGVVSGYPDGTFKPNRVVTRGELATMLVQAKKIPVTTASVTGYSDVSKNNTAAPYIQAAVDSGYLTGRQGDKFEPNKAATRAEAVAAIVKFDRTALPSGLRAGPFPDMTAKEWSSKYVFAAKDAGMLGYLEGQNFEAKRNITRAEVAELLAKTRFGMAKIEELKAASINE